MNNDISNIMSDNCLCCFDTIEKENIVLYKYDQSHDWKMSKYCKSCVILLLNTQWEKYKNGLKDDCKKTVKNLIIAGPPINIKDKFGFPNSNDDKNKESDEVQLLQYDGKIQCAKLVDSLIGEEREQFWNELKSLLEHFDFE